MYQLCMAGRDLGGFDQNKLANLMKKGELEPIPEEYGPVLKKIILRMLTVDPVERPDASELLDTDLEGGLDEDKLRENLKKTTLPMP